jgi:pimeloyl-ACP methyl ester carboxylesterase
VRPDDIASVEPVTSRRGFWWVGVERAAHAAGTVPRGPMFVQWEAPVEVRHELPLVLIHGGGGQGTDYLGTPDGRPGWATHLVREGYVVYVVDRPGHGRSPHHPDVLGPMGPPFSFELAAGLFAPPADAAAAQGHTQWPDGDGRALEQFAAGTGPLLADFAEAQALDRSRGAELLDAIGPAVLVTHSLGGPAGWLIADARPDLVRAIVAVEPVGPPFADTPFGTLEWGLTAAPMAFDPPVEHAGELQAGQPRRLANLGGIPIAVVTSEASPFALFADDVVAFLRAARCTAERLHLPDHGVRGNGHGIMLERNNREALDPILEWLRAAAERAPETKED